MSEITGNIRVETHDHAAILAVEGALRIDRAVEFREALLRGLEPRDQLELDLTGVVEADLSTLQLLCAAHRFGADRGKAVVLKAPGSALEGAAAAAGFRRHRGCIDGCLWAGGAKP